MTDNGHGITEQALSVLPCRYWTSKCNSASTRTQAPHTFGWRGESLASLATISLLEILSTAKSSTRTFQKIVRGTEVQSFKQVPAARVGLRPIDLYKPTLPSSSAPMHLTASYHSSNQACLLYHLFLCVCVYRDLCLENWYYCDCP